MKLNLNEPLFCFTSDLDWNPDAAIRVHLEQFSRHGVKMTVFATHSIAALAGRGPHVQVGAHPNFLLSLSGE